MSSSNNDNDDDNRKNDKKMEISYSTNEEYAKRLNRSDTRSTTDTVEYLEFIAAQEQYSPKNLSLHQDSLSLLSQSQQKQQQLPTKEQFTQMKQVPSTTLHYVISPDNNLQQGLTNTFNNNYNYNYNYNNNGNSSNSNSNNNYYGYNPYFPPTEQQMQQFYYTSLNEVAHNDPRPNRHQIGGDTNQQQRQQSRQSQQLQQFQRHTVQHNNNDDGDSNNDRDDNVQIDHSTVTPSPLSLPGLSLTRNRSRVSTPKIENSPRIPSAYTAQVQQSDSPLRTEFRNSDINSSHVGSSRINNTNNVRLNNGRLTNVNERGLMKFDFRNADGDPDDPLLNNDIQTQEEEQPLPTGLLTGNINNNTSNINSHQHPSIVTPDSNTSVIPIIQTPNENVDEKHDVIEIGPDVKIKIYAPKQGAVLMLLFTFIIGAIVAITWKLGDWGIGNAQEVFNTSTNNGFLKIYPSSSG